MLQTKSSSVNHVAAKKKINRKKPLQSTVLVWERRKPPWWDLSYEETQSQEGTLAEGDDEEAPEHPEIDEECPNCGNPKLQFWTRQLRSADEGQSVFYLCKKCGWRACDR